MIGIIGAMDVEVFALLELMDDVDEKNIKGQVFYRGKINRKNVVLTKSGVGKTLSSMTTTALVLNFDIKLVINIGSAGALSPKVNVLDVVLSDKVAMYDFDLTAFGYQQSFLESRYTFQADQMMIDHIKSLSIEGLHIGNIVSGDTFVSTKSQMDRILGNYDTALCVDMEAASIAMVLEHYVIPFVVIRSISDSPYLTSDNKLEYEQYLEIASKNSAAMTKRIIESL